MSHIHLNLSEDVHKQLRTVKKKTKVPIVAQIEMLVRTSMKEASNV